MAASLLHHAGSAHLHVPTSLDGAPRDAGARPAAEIETLFYDPDAGWSGPLPALDSEGTLVMVFGAGALHSAVRPVGELVGAYPRSRMVGCSSPAGAGGPGGVSVTLLRFHHTHLHTACIPAAPPCNARALGEELVGKLLAPALKGVMLFPGAPAVDNGELFRGVRAALPRAVTLTSFAGGTGQSWAVGWGGPQRNVVAAVGLYGERVEIKVETPWHEKEKAKKP